MKFKVLRESETGKRIAEIERMASLAHDDAKNLANDIGFEQWRGGYWCAFGGISCVMFKKVPDTKLWKKQEDGYYPKKNSKEGKELAQRFDALTVVSLKDLNESVGFGGAPWKHIGINFNNKDYFGFEVGDKWEYTPPSDCVEITHSEFRTLFP